MRLSGLFRWLRRNWFVQPHECDECGHVLPSHRARFHAGSRYYIHTPKA